MAALGANILLVDDGELDEAAAVLEAQKLPYERLRGGQIPAEVAPPRDLLIITPRRLERMLPGNPPDAQGDRPLRIVAVREDSPAMRRRLRRSGLHLLVRIPAGAEIWRLLVARALYRGNERRKMPRVAVGTPVAFDADPGSLPTAGPEAMLVDLSNRGCRLQTGSALSVGDAVTFTLPGDEGGNGGNEPITLSGRAVRVMADKASGRRTLAVVFDPEMPQKSRSRLTALINRWASGPDSLAATSLAGGPPIPPCQLPSLPDLTLDDETDPPIVAGSEVRVELAGLDHSDSTAPPRQRCERRGRPRGRYESPLLAKGTEGPIVLIGRDLSAGGMRIERHDGLRVGHRFRIALHGPARSRPFLVDAEITRDDGDEGFGVVFHDIDPSTATSIEKLVACLPDVESLEDGEMGGLGAILSEIMTDSP